MYNIYLLTKLDVSHWIKHLKPYEGFRDGVIAHFQLIKPLVPNVDYQIFLNLLEEFECKLQEIHRKYITHNSVKYGTWSVSTANFDTQMLVELRQLLKCSCDCSYKN